MMRTVAAVTVYLGLMLSVFAARASDRDMPDYKQRDSIFAATGFQGGLIVHLGCGEGRLTAAFRKQEGYVIHGLDTDAARIAEARRYIRSQGIYGLVSVEQWDSPELPYVDNIVNLMVAEKPGDVSADEMMRPGRRHPVCSWGEFSPRQALEGLRCRTPVAGHQRRGRHRVGPPSD